jgi:hypothetical protein
MWFEDELSELREVMDEITERIIERDLEATWLGLALDEMPS